MKYFIRDIKVIFDTSLLEDLTSLKRTKKYKIQDRNFKKKKKIVFSKLNFYTSNFFILFYDETLQTSNRLYYIWYIIFMYRNKFDLQ